jgi:hypothetical protein
VFYSVSNTYLSWLDFYKQCTLIKRNPALSRKMFSSLEIPFKTGFSSSSICSNSYEIDVTMVTMVVMVICLKY